MSGHCHATISLICMSTHKATAARCLSYHQAAYGQPAIRALAVAPLRKLALSVLFTIMTNSYQTTCTISERTFNKRQHANARQGVDFLLFMHYNIVYHVPPTVATICLHLWQSWVLWCPFFVTRYLKQVSYVSLIMVTRRFIPCGQTDRHD